MIRPSILLCCAALLGLDGCERPSPLHEKLSPSGRADCARSGGRVEAVGLAMAQMCVRLFADRGKECRSDRECMGECRYTDDSRGPPPPDASLVKEPAWMHPSDTLRPGSPVVGHCQWSSNPFGCRSKVADGKLEEAECID